MAILKYKISDLTEQELKGLCDWISHSGDLPMISSLKKSDLLIEELTEWINSSKAYAVIKDDGLIVGFGTMTQAEESSLGKRDVEMCHLIIHPDYRLKYNGSNLLLSLIEEAENHNYERIVGRVNKQNAQGQRLMMHLKWSLIENLSGDNSVNWYEHPLSQESLSTYLMRRIKALDLTNRQLADLLSITPNYINTLRNPRVGAKTKSLSWKLAKELAFILAQNDRDIFDEFFRWRNKNRSEYKSKISSLETDAQKSKMKKWSQKWNLKSYLINIKKDKRSISLMENSKPEHIFDMLFSMSKLGDFKSKVVYADNTLTKGEIVKRIEEVNKTSLNKVNDDWEIWTISDLFGEQEHQPSILETATNILSYKIKYKYFTSYTDDVNWKIAYKNIREAAIKLFKDNEGYYSNIWNNPDNYITNQKSNLDDYLSFYGVPESMLFFRMRIYNARSQEANANVNLGGTTRDDALFVDVKKTVTQKVTKLVPQIFRYEELLNQDDNKLNKNDDIVINVKSENIIVCRKNHKA